MLRGQRHTPSAKASAPGGTPGRGVAVGGCGVGGEVRVGDGVHVGIAVGTAVWVGVCAHVGVGAGTRVGVKVGTGEGVTVRVGVRGVGATVNEGLSTASAACAAISAPRGGEAVQPTRAKRNTPIKEAFRTRISPHPAHARCTRTAHHNGLAPHRNLKQNRALLKRGSPRNSRAGDAIRTRDNLLGRQELCQLSYARKSG